MGELIHYRLFVVVNVYQTYCVVGHPLVIHQGWTVVTIYCLQLMPLYSVSVNDVTYQHQQCCKQTLHKFLCRGVTSLWRFWSK